MCWKQAVEKEQASPTVLDATATEVGVGTAVANRDFIGRAFTPYGASSIQAVLDQFSCVNKYDKHNGS